MFLYAYLNAFFESGYLNPIDETIRTHGEPIPKRRAYTSVLVLGSASGIWRAGRRAGGLWAPLVSYRAGRTSR